MEGIQIIFYLIIVVVYIIIAANNNKKKREKALAEKAAKMKNQQTSSFDTSDNIPQKKETSILDEFLSQLEEPMETKTSQVESPTPRYISLESQSHNYDEDAISHLGEYTNYDKDTSDAFFQNADKIIHEGIEQDPNAFYKKAEEALTGKHFKRSESKKKKEHPFLTFMKEPDNVKKIVIAKEIFDKKY